jgi:hypothetical protein
MMGSVSVVLRGDGPWERDGSSGWADRGENESGP